MKLRKRLALVLAASMMASLLPMAAFATTENRVSRVVTVADDAEFTTSVSGLDMTEATQEVQKQNFPEIVIKNTKKDMKSGQFIYLNLENAEWIATDATDSDDNEKASMEDIKIQLNKTVEDENGVEQQQERVGATFQIIDDTTVKVTFSGTLEKDDEFRIPLLTEVTGDGPAKVTIDSANTGVTAGTYTYAVIGGTKTKIKVDEDDVEVFGDDEGEAVTITIEELYSGAIEADKELVLELTDSDFEFVNDGEVTVDGLNGVKLDLENSDEREIKFETSKSSTTSSQPGRITIKGLKIKATKDADYGDVNVEVSGDFVDTKEFTVAKYADYGVELTSGDAETLYTTQEPEKTAEITLEETMLNSWLEGRKLDIEIPEWVNVTEVTKAELTGLEYNGSEDIKTELEDLFKVNEKREDKEHEVSITFDRDGSDDKAKLELEVKLEVQQGHEGDIEFKFGGRALPEELTVVPAIAKEAFEVEAEQTQLQVGVRRQEVGTITITETAKKHFMKNKTVYVDFDDRDLEWAEEPTVKVTEGNAKIDDVKLSDGILEFKIDGDSTKPSTIEISNGEVKVDRSVADGKYDVRIYGEGVIDGCKLDSAEPKDSDWDQITLEDMIVVSDEDGLVSGTTQNVVKPAAFTIGAKAYVSGEQKFEMDAAPYIKNGRTMVPVKYAAYALGFTADQITFANGTVTLLGDKRVIQVKVGSNDLLINGAKLTMDVPAVVKEGRTYLPISWVAKALGTPFAYDQATQTVTFNK